MNIDELKEQYFIQIQLKRYLRKTFQLKPIDVFLMRDLYKSKSNSIQLRDMITHYEIISDQSSIVMSINKLIKLNLITKTRNKKDERTVTIHITTEQKQKIKQYLDEITKFMKKSLNE